MFGTGDGDDVAGGSQRSAEFVCHGSGSGKAGMTL